MEWPCTRRSSELEVVMHDIHGAAAPVEIAVVSGSPTVISLVGEIDAANADQVGSAFDEVTAGDVVVDMRQVSFGSCALLSRLLRLRRHVTSRGDRLDVAGVSAAMARLLDLSGTTHLFPHRSAPTNQRQPSSDEPRAAG
ncbi:MAG: Anti-sigma factor antagonist [Ilumatobacteraceae bacterium]|nr:Anti-sigma factor antagonist [Ilumatobacteraceae bacterium]